MNIKKVAVIVLILTSVYMLSSCKNISSDLSSIEETIIIDNTDVSSDTTSVEESPVASEPAEEPVASKEEASTPAQTNSSQPSQTTTPAATEESKPSQNQSTSSPASGKKFVQRADPETGISWDGVSPIIYTYEDGTTGTEKREGAKYEAYPGMWTTVVTIEKGDGEYDGRCVYCGKLGGDGSNDTCIRYWTGGDHNCECCGAVIPEDTCHTCAD